MAMKEKADNLIVIVTTICFYSGFVCYSPCGPKEVSIGPLELDEFLEILCSWINSQRCKKSVNAEYTCCERFFSGL